MLLNKCVLFILILLFFINYQTLDYYFINYDKIELFNNHFERGSYVNGGNIGQNKEPHNLNEVSTKNNIVDCNNYTNKNKNKNKPRKNDVLDNGKCCLSNKSQGNTEEEINKQ